MTAEFGFIEITTNARDFDFTVDKLISLGYTVAAKNHTSEYSIWKLNLNIIFLRKKQNYTDLPALTGLGFIASMELITELDCEYCEDLEFYKTTDPNGYNIYLLLDSKFKKSVISKSYKTFKQTKIINSAKLLKYFSGIVYDSFTEELQNFYNKLGFRVVKTGNTYINMVTKNNRFTIMFNFTYNVNSRITSLISDTDDVFYSTAFFSNNNFNLKKYDRLESCDFGNLAFKINGYNCFALGNENSYTIENNLVKILPNLDLIFRQRQKYIHINEVAVAEHLRIEI